MAWSITTRFSPKMGTECLIATTTTSSKVVWGRWSFAENNHISKKFPICRLYFNFQIVDKKYPVTADSSLARARVSQNSVHDSSPASDPAIPLFWLLHHKSCGLYFSTIGGWGRPTRYATFWSAVPLSTLQDHARSKSSPPLMWYAFNNSL